VADVLEEAEISLDPDLEHSSPDLEAELEMDYIVIKKAAQVILKVDGQELEIISWAESVDELLAEQNIVLDDDLVSLPLTQSLKSGMVIEVVRVDRELVYEDVVLSAKTTFKNDSTLPSGQEKLQTKAEDGKKQITYEVTYHDGVEVGRRMVSEKVVANPVTGVILKGTRTSVSRGSTPPSSSNQVIQGIASFYGAELHGNKTASGVPFDMNAFTAAHKTLPFGTKVRVTYISTGKSVVVEINDRGPFTPGRVIDLSAAAAKEIGLYADGIGKVKIEILN